MKVKFIVSALILFTASNLFAQGFSNVGSAGGNFLKIPVEPVGAALGNSYVSSVKGVAGLYWNPAALAYTEGSEVLVSNVSWLADTRVSFAGIAHNIGSGTIGLSVTALTMDEMEITTETSPNGTGAFFNAGSYSFGVSYGMKIIDRFSFGLTAKYVYEFIWETNGSVILFDLGSVYETEFYNLKIGMRLTNFGGNMKYEGAPIDNKADVVNASGFSYSFDPRLDRVSPDFQLPQLFNVGISFEPFEFDGQKLIISASINDPNDNDTQLLFGSEYAWNDKIFLRAGYKSGFDEQNLSAGIGTKLNIGSFTTKLDLAYVDFGKLGEVIFLGLGFGL